MFEPPYRRRWLRRTIGFDAVKHLAALPDREAARPRFEPAGPSLSACCARGAATYLGFARTWGS